MDKARQMEFWLRGALPHIPALLQPVAHALLQAREEVGELMVGFPEVHLWDMPAGVASPGFHLQHLAGVLDRLFTYARGEVLSERQLEELFGEGKPMEGMDTIAGLLERFNQQIDRSLDQLRQTSGLTLTAQREVGRNKAPSTVGGLLFHAAEHTQRHVGQLLVTVRILLA